MSTITPQANHNDALHIAFCVDNNYFRAMGSMIASLIQHNPQRRFVFHVFAFSISDDNARRIKEVEANPLIEVVSHVVDKSLFRDFAEMIASSYYSLSTFTRLVVPSVLKDITDRVLYLDADMLCAGSLDELAAMSLDDTVALVVNDVGWETPAGHDGRYSVLGMREKRYFNAGILYINIPEWEKHEISAKAIRLLLSDAKRLTFNDQDALNIVLEGLVRYIPIKWNYIYSMVADLKQGKLEMDAVGDAAIVHYAGLIKPWNAWTGHAACQTYKHYHALSAWSDLPLDQAPLSHKEMRIASRAQFAQGRTFAGICLYLRALRLAAAKKLKR